MSKSEKKQHNYVRLPQPSSSFLFLIGMTAGLFLLASIGFFSVYQQKLSHAGAIAAVVGAQGGSTSDMQAIASETLRAMSIPVMALSVGATRSDSRPAAQMFGIVSATASGPPLPFACTVEIPPGTVISYLLVAATQAQGQWCDVGNLDRNLWLPVIEPPVATNPPTIPDGSWVLLSDDNQTRGYTFDCGQQYGGDPPSPSAPLVGGHAFQPTAPSPHQPLWPFPISPGKSDP